MIIVQNFITLLTIKIQKNFSENFFPSKIDTFHSKFATKMFFFRSK